MDEQATYHPLVVLHDIVIVLDYSILGYGQHDEREVLPPNSEVTRAAIAVTTASHGIEVVVEFKPVKHPSEPLDTNKPIQCPLPEPSILNVICPVEVSMTLKAANLLMDENEVVQVADFGFADFGVARVKTQSGVMTAETGTYWWMAPEASGCNTRLCFQNKPCGSVGRKIVFEILIILFRTFQVIEHKPYDHEADVFSFTIVLWELLTGKLPYEYLTPLQAAVGVVQRGLRPIIPKHTHPKLAELLEKCWQQDPALRPDFSEIIEILQQTAKEVGDEGEGRHKEKSSGGFLSVLRRGHH
ncbi:hypothetical protein CMV_022183 [Castanea mollissima]|uniref:Protein kinase domain-containing protein n=1 Tax=Castanea mollissima TaxID=60419 RepID=A0A8J4V8B4_9ROSI|nr:hypothetical protein CMV_022183 [Castanea mollissima]